MTTLDVEMLPTWDLKPASKGTQRPESGRPPPGCSPDGRRFAYGAYPIAEAGGR